jgi:penicillin-binding protein 1B
MEDSQTASDNPLLQRVARKLRTLIDVIRKYRIRIALCTGALLLIGIGTFAFYYHRYAMLIEDKFGGGVIRTNSSVYAMPRQVVKGDKLTEQDLVARLQRAGYTEDANNKVGHYRGTSKGLVIATGPNSYFEPHTAIVRIEKNRVADVYSQTEDRVTGRLWLEPELITNLFDADREKRRPVAYSELPKRLIDAVISVEDKRFFNHMGLDMIRLAKAAYVDIREGSKEQGASTITMQLARSFWLEQDKTFKRKMAEILLTIELERRFSKPEILGFYINEVYLGRRGSFSLHGFGEAARAYFGKDIRQLTLPEAATLAGIIQRPSYFNPFRYPDRVKGRRNLVLQLMRDNGYLDAAAYQAAVATPLVITAGETESSEAPYFVDLVNEDLQGRFKDQDFATNSFRVYSTLDLDLQKAAVESVQQSMEDLDKQLRRRRGKNKDGKFPQVALIALDPKTGQVRALVGGRNYTDSQLNRSLAKRQPGSAFKPFVFAAALNQGVQGKGKSGIVTAATPLEDEPTTFTFNQQIYEPANYRNEYHGPVTMRLAIAKSMNIPTIKIAEMAGYESVAQLVKDAGISSPVVGTPSLALGSYEVMPLELAEAYTIFANQGIHVNRSFVTSIRDRRNRIVFAHRPQGNKVLDERVAFMMTNLMEEVMRSGTGAGARARGFQAPAAGKTGTSRDGWFVGYTSELVTVVWIGYDDNAEFELEAAHSALPVWTNFMKRAHALRQYSDARAFAPPKGLVRVDIDPYSGMLADEDCPLTAPEYFLAGTEPQEFCDHERFEELLEERLREAEGLPPEDPRKNIFRSILGVFR